MAFAAIMGGIAIAGMIGNVAGAGEDAGKNADELRKNIKDVEAATASMKAKWDSVISQETALDDQVKADIIKDIDDIAQISAKAKVAKDNFSVQYRKIQMAGVLFVVAIFFLLLLKQTGILDSIEDLFLSPFKGSTKSS
jgi:hypothetical protein